MDCIGGGTDRAEANTASNMSANIPALARANEYGMENSDPSSALSIVTNSGWGSRRGGGTGGADGIGGKKGTASLVKGCSTTGGAGGAQSGDKA